MFAAAYHALLSVVFSPLKMLTAIYNIILSVAGLLLNVLAPFYRLFLAIARQPLNLLAFIGRQAFAIASLTLNVPAAVFSALSRLTGPMKILLLKAKGALMTRWGVAFAVLLFVAVVLLSLAERRVTSCTCGCIRITPYSSFGVTTLAVTGCLHCDESGQLSKAAADALSALRHQRNKVGFWGTAGAALSVAGHFVSGPLFDIISGNGVGVALKARKFYCINTAVNTLKAFEANVLKARLPIAGCCCRRAEARRAISGYCDLAGGELPDIDAVEVDKDGVFSYVLEKAGELFF